MSGRTILHLSLGGCAIAASLAAAFSQPLARPAVTARAALAVSTPVPNPPVRCPQAPDLRSLRESAVLELDDLQAVSMSPHDLYPSDNQDVELSWIGLDLDVGCIAVYLLEGPDTERFRDRPWALLGPQQNSWVHRSVNAPGRYCYRLVAVGEDQRGPFSEACADVSSIREPTGGITFGRFILIAGVAALALAALLFFLRRRAFASASHLHGAHRAEVGHRSSLSKNLPSPSVVGRGVGGEGSHMRSVCVLSRPPRQRSRPQDPREHSFMAWDNT